MLLFCALNMAESVPKICRICLEQLDKNEQSHFLNNGNGSMLLSKLLDFLPEIDLDFVINPISCNQCKITIDRIHELKKLSVQTESVLNELKKQRKSFNDVVCFVKSETEIEMIKEEFLEDKIKDEYTINMTENVVKICRICLEQLGENVHFYFLNNNNSMMLLSKLLDILPKIDLDFVQNPISCNRCMITIDQINKFKKLCVQTENVVNNLKMQGKSFDDVISHIKKNTYIETIKEEFFEDKCKDEPLIVKNDCLEVNTDLPICIEVPTKLLFFCYTCDYTTYNKKNLRRHVYIHRLQVRQLQCDQCSYTTPNNSSLTAHKRCHLKINCVQKNTLKVHISDKPYNCKKCDYRCKFKESLKIHIRTHTGEKPYKCNICNYRCSQKANLKTHTNTHTGEKPYKCDDCDYRFHQKSHLKMHIITHTGEKMYKCDVCDYRSSNKSILKKHVHTHTEEKLYKCDVCDYCCNHKMNLKMHMHTHTEEKPYKCDVCDFCCNYKSNLKKHTRTHTEEKPYKCDICNYSCNQKGNLKVHLKSHTGEKPYKCTECDYKTAYAHSLRYHQLSHNGN